MIKRRNTGRRVSDATVQNFRRELERLFVVEGLTGREISEATGINQGQIYRYRNGNRRPSSAAVDAIRAFALSRGADAPEATDTQVVDPVDAEPVGPFMRPRLNVTERRRFNDLIVECREIYGKENREIGEAIGVRANQVSKYLGRQQDPPRKRYNALVAYHASLSTNGANPQPAEPMSWYSPELKRLRSVTTVDMFDPEPPKNVPDSRSEFERYLAAARDVAYDLVERIELLGVAAPGFAQEGIRAMYGRAQEIAHELDS